MTSTPMPPSTGDEKVPQDPHEKERLDTDPAQEPNAPNREPDTEVVGPGLTDDTKLDTASVDDELDRPDNPALS